MHDVYYLYMQHRFRFCIMC